MQPRMLHGEGTYPHTTHPTPYTHLPTPRPYVHAPTVWGCAITTPPNPPHVHDPTPFPSTTHPCAHWAPAAATPQGSAVCMVPHARGAPRSSRAVPTAATSLYSGSRYLDVEL